MSYILDALRRSDQDRKRGDVPDLQSQPNELVLSPSDPSKPARKNRLIWVVWALAALVLVWVFSRSTSVGTDEPMVAVTAAEGERNPSEAVAPVTAAESERNPPEDIAPVIETVPPEQEQPPGDEVYLEELRDVQLDISPMGEPEVPVSQPPAVEASAALAATAEASVTEAPDAPVAGSSERLAEAEPPSEPDQSASAANEPAASTEPDAPPDPYEGIPHQRQLDHDLQQALPELNISVHLYSAMPPSRLVRINNRIYHEGDVVDRELKLEQITPDGLILSIRDQRFWRHAR